MKHENQKYLSIFLVYTKYECFIKSINQSIQFNSRKNEKKIVSFNGSFIFQIPFSKDSNLEIVKRKKTVEQKIFSLVIVSISTVPYFYSSSFN